jgi:nucleoside-diphosphate-sugar epimerase
MQLLLTGATGFLGGAIAAELAGTPHWDRTLFLVRAPDRAAGLARLRETLARFEVAPARIAHLGARQVVPGDLAAPEAIFEGADLSGVTHVINGGALATFGNNPRLWEINVEGSFRFIARLAGVARLARFVQVGTAMCVGPDAPSPVAEDWQPPGDARHLVPYTRTKIALEERLLAELPNLPLVRARPTIVVGHTRLGTRPSASIYWVFRSVQLLEKFMIALDDRVDVVPVDWTARTLLDLATRPTLKHAFYHLSAGPDHASTFRELDAAMARGRGVAPRAAVYERIEPAGLDALIGVFRERLGPCSPRIMLRALKLYGVFAALGMTFRNDHLGDEGIAAPPPFASYADLCAATAESGTVAEQMMADFK